MTLSSETPPCIFLIGIGGVNSDTLQKISTFLGSHCNQIEIVVSSMKTPVFAYNTERNQYDAKQILEELERNCPDNALKIIGVTWLDLYLPVLKYVYGSAQVEGKCAVFSLHRLHPRFYSEAEADNEELFDCRVEKTTLHEIAHTFGLTHCHEPDCVMYSSSRIEDTDCKSARFCDSCREVFQWMVEKAAESLKSSLPKK